MSADSVPSARVLRLLATNHIFIEVLPDVFANNRLSTVLDTGKPVEELISKWALFAIAKHNKLTDDFSPELKHIGTLGIASYIEHVYEFPFGVILIWALTTFPQS